MRRRSQRLKDKHSEPAEEIRDNLDNTSTAETTSCAPISDLTSDPLQVCVPNAAVEEDAISESVPSPVSPYKPSASIDTESNQGDSDEAPDDITLVEGRVAAIGTLKNEQDQIKRYSITQAVRD